MECYNCGSAIERADVCPVCGCDLRSYIGFLDISDHLYNKALRQARERNLYGAVSTLKLSLFYNKVNIEARNLLGLVYYERGEATLAIREWMISKSYKPEDNLAGDFLEDTDRNTIERERITQTVKKYNVIVNQLRSGSYDLAAMQLKKVISIAPNFVRARQMLALLFLMDERYEDAALQLDSAMRTDAGDPLTLLYLKAARDMKKGKTRPKASATRKKEGNDIIITPKHSKVNGVVNVILNFLIGVVIGAAIIWYLAVPTIKRDAASETNAVSVQSSETIAAKNQQISALEEDVKELKASLSEAEKSISEHDREIDSYDSLLNAYRAYAKGDPDAAGEKLDGINTDLLSSKGKKYYQFLSDKIITDYLEQTYEEATKLYNKNNITDAKGYYERIIALDESYDEGNALYNLAQCHRKLREYDEALKIYKQVVKLFPDTDIAANAGVYIAQLSED